MYSAYPLIVTPLIVRFCDFSQMPEKIWLKSIRLILRFFFIFFVTITVNENTYFQGPLKLFLFSQIMLKMTLYYFLLQYL